MYNEASKGPAFVFNEEFLRTYRLRHRMPVVKSPVNIIDLNFTLLGRTAKLRKDYVRPAIVEMMAQIGEAAAKADRPLRIEFPFVGWLNADHRRAHFVFGDNNPLDERGPATFTSKPLASALRLNLDSVRVPDVPPRRPLREDDTSNYESERYSEAEYEKSSGRTMPESEYNASQAYTESEYSPTTHVSSESRSVRVPTIFPVFLNPDADSHEHATKKNEFVEKNNVGMFELREKQMLEELEHLREEEAERQERKLRSEIEYKKKRLLAKKELLDLNAYRLQQALERQERDRAAEIDMKSATVLTLNGLESIVGETRIAARDLEAKRSMSTALKSQMASKAHAKNEQRQQDLAQETYFLNCVHEHLAQSRARKTEKRRKLRSELRESWDRQKRLARLQKRLVAAKNGRNSALRGRRHANGADGGGLEIVSSRLKPSNH